MKVERSFSKRSIEKTLRQQRVAELIKKGKLRSPSDLCKHGICPVCLINDCLYPHKTG